MLFFCLTESLSQIWNDYCEAHEAYQFLRKKHTDRYKGGIKIWLKFDKCRDMFSFIDTSMFTLVTKATLGPRICNTFLILILYLSFAIIAHYTIVFKSFSQDYIPAPRYK